MKRCASCKQLKPLFQFHRKSSTKDGYHNYCKSCTKLKNAEWVKANKVKHAATCAEWYRKNKPKANKRSTDWHYKTNYGISREEYATLVAEVGGLCQICLRPLVITGRGKSRAVIDHNHTTGQVRGVLCGPCNLGIGLLEDSIPRLEMAIVYLLQNPTA